MLMKRILLSALCVVMALAASAQSLDYIVVQQADGQQVSLPAVGLKITFRNQTMHAVSGTQVADFPLTGLTKMFFSATPTAVENVTVQQGMVRIVNGRLQVNAPAGAKVSVYTPDGRQVEGNSLLHGVYLVKVNGRTYKLMAK